MDLWHILIAFAATVVAVCIGLALAYGLERFLETFDPKDGWGDE